MIAITNTVTATLQVNVWWNLKALMHSAISITEQNDTNKVQKTNAQTTTECQVKKIIKNNKKKQQ